MKKFISVCIALAITTFSTMTAVAAETNHYTPEQLISETTEYFDDGSSITTTIYETPITTRSSTYTKTGTKQSISRDRNGNIEWKFTIHGTFSVNSGVSSNCTKASYSTSSLASGWSLKTGSAKKSGRQAIGDGTFEHKTLFVVTSTKSCHVVLTCDANGNLT